MSLPEALRNSQRFVCLYGTTPPRADTSDEKALRAAERLHARTHALPLDGIVVYDIQDEGQRTGVERPFPFLPVRESRAYARTLHEITGRPIICYKCIGNATLEGWRHWLASSLEDYGLESLSIVGRASSRQASDGIRMSEAMIEAAGAQREHPDRGLILGGVAIPERHTAERSESLRLIEKISLGCEYFISQAVYAPGIVVRMLKDYSADCARLGVAPARIVLTFTPCGNERTLAFMKWLGIAVAADSERAILAAQDPLSESIRICAANLKQVLEEAGNTGIPLGINVESVSIRKDEIDASIDLFHALMNVSTPNR